MGVSPYGSNPQRYYSQKKIPKDIKGTTCTMAYPTPLLKLFFKCFGIYNIHLKGSN